MYEIQVIEELDSGHILDLPYESKCKNIHGHRWRVTVTIASEDLNKYGMVVDFVHVKEVLKKSDHKFFICAGHSFMQIGGLFRDAYTRVPGHFDTFGIIVLPFEPTAENLAKLFFENVSTYLISIPEIPISKNARIVSVELWETESGRVVYKP